MIAKLSQESYDELTELATGDVFLKKVFSKIRYIHRKTPVLGSLFNKAAALRPATVATG